MKLATALLALAVSAQNARADQQQAPDFTIATATAAGAFDVTATPPAGHHINVKAPMEGEDLKSGDHVKPASAKATKAVFRFKGAEARDVVLRLYLCDDANTYCEKHEVKASAGGSRATPPSGAPSAAKLQTTGGPKTGTELGFILNDPKAALAEAARKKAPLMIDFYGIWCPPCNMLDETVFPTNQFKAATSGFVKLKLDADAPVSWNLKSKYRVVGYPTIVFASADGDEISRIVGFRPRDEFLAEIASAWRDRETPFSVVKKKADEGDAAAALKAGRALLTREDYAEAERYLEKASGQDGANVELFRARVGRATGGSQDALADVLEQALRAHPDDFEAFDWHMQLASAYEQLGKSEKSREQFAAVLTTVDALVSHPEKLAGHDALPADLLETAADAQEKLGPPEKAHAAWSRAADAYRAELKRSGRGEAAERGFNLELAYCLGKLGDTAAAEKIYSRLEGRFPREFTFYYAHARMLLNLKKNTRSRELASKAYEFSYGDNRLRAAELLAKAYAAEGNVTDALQTIRGSLEATPLPADSSIRTHRYADKLKTLEKSLTAR